MATPPNPFEQLAEHCGLRVQAQPLSVAPRDVLAPLAEMEQHYLVTVCRDVSTDPVRLIFAQPLSDPSPPSVRDVLWWLASDAWAVARASGELRSWSSTFGYPAQAESTRRLFEYHVRQASALASLLGELGYRRLLALYDADLSGRLSPT